MDHSEKRPYFTKKNKTKDDIDRHNSAQMKKHKDRMKSYYKKKKMLVNGTVKYKFQKIYNVINSLGGYTDVGEIDTKMETIAISKYKCLCFDKIYDAYLNMKENEDKDD